MEFSNEDIESWICEPVESFSSGEGTKKGDNVASDITRIEVRAVSGKLYTLVYKQFPKNAPVQAEYAIVGKIYWREHEFYKSLAPAIASSAASRLKEIKSEEPKFKLPIPKFFAGFNNDVDDFICLGDLRPQGFVMPDKTVGLNEGEMTLAMTKIAEFHALSYFWLKNQGEGIFLKEEYTPYLMKHWVIPLELIYDGPDSLAAKNQIIQYTAFFAEIHRNSMELVREFGVGADKEILAKKMAGNSNSILNNVYNIVAQTTHGTDSKYFPLVIHGDLWLNNLLFSYDARGKPTDMKLLDFQFTRRGNIYEDLNYFVYTSTTAEFRKKYLVTILHAYYDAFVCTLDKLKFPLPLGFSRGTFVNGFYENILPIYAFLGFALPLQLGKDSEDEKASAEAEYTTELRLKMERSPLAILRLEEATREMVEMGFF